MYDFCAIKKTYCNEYLMVKDGKTKGDESVFCKYNIFYKNNKVPKKLSIFLLVLALVVSVLRVVMILTG